MSERRPGGRIVRRRPSVWRSSYRPAPRGGGDVALRLDGRRRVLRFPFDHLVLAAAVTQRSPHIRNALGEVAGVTAAEARPAHSRACQRQLLVPAVFLAGRGRREAHDRSSLRCPCDDVLAVQLPAASRAATEAPSDVSSSTGVLERKRSRHDLGRGSRCRPQGEPAAGDREATRLSSCSRLPSRGQPFPHRGRGG